MFIDGRFSNSRGGKGIGATTFENFWGACREVLLPDSAANERRQSDTVYASAAHSIPNLIKMATDILQRKVDAQALARLPPIPSEEWVRLQFVPNVRNSETSAKFTGALGASRAVQTRTLRKEHVDQHFVNAMTRYYLEWIIELKSNYDGVEFYGQDDKAKIACGDAVPISTGVRANNKGIVADGDRQGLKALDHDFHYANIIPSVTLLSNIPNDISGSFFIGDKDSIGQIFVTLKDATFDASNVFDHCAQLIDTLCNKGLTPTVLVLQTDGGPDHSLTRVATKFAMIAVFKDLDLDHLVILRGAPNGSARNKIERAMSVLNLPLAHMAVRRQDMSKWAELELKSASSMKAVRDIGEKLNERRKKAVADIPDLEKKYNNLAIAEEVTSSIQKMIEAGSASGQLPPERVIDSTTSTTNLVYRYLGIRIRGLTLGTLGSSSGVAGALITETGPAILLNSSLPSRVAKAKLDKATTEASQDFLQEWKDSIGVPITAISQRFASLTTSGRDVVMLPRVPEAQVTLLHNLLKEIDPMYNSSVMTTAHLSKVPSLVNYIESHAITTPYSFSITKCVREGCCGDLRTPVEVRELAMQRQPTPRADPNQDGHFLRHEQALLESANNQKLFTDLLDMPLSVGDPKKKEAKTRKVRDEKICKELKLKSWDGKKVRGFVTCFHCAKRRCVYTGVEQDYLAARVAFQQKLESVSGRFSCGDLLFDDNHPLSKVIVQKQSLTCESQIEKGYYNKIERALKLKDLCIHCGSQADDEEDDDTFLLRLPQLQERLMTDGYICYPMCIIFAIPCV